MLIRPLQFVRVAICVAVVHGAVVTLGAQAAPTMDSGVVVRVMVSRSGAPLARRLPNVGMQVTRLGARQRVDLLRAAGDSLGTEWVMLHDTVPTITIHDRAKRATMVMRLGDIRSLFTDMLHARVDSTSESVQLLGAGTPVLGYATQRVRVMRQFRLQTSLGDKTQRVMVRTLTEALIAPELPASYGAPAVLSLTAASGAAFVQSVLTPVGLRAADRRGPALPPGMMMRGVTRTTVEQSGGDVAPFLGAAAPETRDSLEVVSIERRPVPPALFDAPDGYEVTDLGAQLRQLVAMVKDIPAVTATGGGRVVPKPTWKPSKPTGKP